MRKRSHRLLLSKINLDISALYWRIDPANKTKTIKNIGYTEECIRIFNKFKALNDNFEI